MNEEKEGKVNIGAIEDRYINMLSHSLSKLREKIRCYKKQSYTGHQDVYQKNSYYKNSSSEIKQTNQISVRNAMLINECSIEINALLEKLTRCNKVMNEICEAISIQAKKMAHVSNSTISSLGATENDND